MRLRSLLMYLIVISAITTSSISFAQITGDLEIKVADSSAAVIPNSEISVRSTETGTTRVATTDATGVARVTQLSIGSYQIHVTMSGFNTIKTVAVVTSGSTTVVPVTLEISMSRQEIVVNDVAAPINTVNAQLQNSVESREITRLPLVGGNVLALAATAPGVV